MPRGGWLTYLRPQAGTEIPASFRLIVAAVSGATLSLSYTGLYLSIYSWVCVGILLLSLFGVRPRVAFACGFLHGLLFVITALPWIATVLAVHGGISLAGGWSLLLLIALAWCQSLKLIISRAPCSSIFRRWNRIRRIGFRRTPRTSRKSCASAWPLPWTSPTFLYGLKRLPRSPTKMRNSQRLPQPWRFVSATLSSPVPSNGNHRWTHRTRRLAGLSCRTTARYFLMRKAGASSCTTRSILCHSANTSRFR